MSVKLTAAEARNSVIPSLGKLIDMERSHISLKTRGFDITGATITLTPFEC